MAFGRKSKKGGGNAAPPEDSAQPQSSQDQPVTKKRRKPNEMLASVVRESAPGAAIDLLSQNERFALPGGNAWVALVLSAESIGGLSKKQSGDEDKGSIIELITADQIEVVVTRLLLAEEFLGIIPTESTLGRMDEYSLLTEAPYYWAVMRLDEARTEVLVDPVAEATYADAVTVSKGDRSIADVLPQVWAWAQDGGSAQGDGTHAPKEAPNNPSAENGLAAQSADTASSQPDPAEDTVAMDAVADPAETQQSQDATAEAIPAQPEQTPAQAAGDDPMADAVVEPDDGVDYAAMDEEGKEDDGDEVPDESDYAEGFDETDLPDDQGEEYYDEDGEGLFDDEDSDDDADAYLQYVEENRDRVVDEDEARESIARRFMSGELDLIVNRDDFETMFNTAAPAITIDVAEDPSDWMGSQVAQLTRQANAELQKAHADHIDELRQLYVEMMSLHAEQVIKNVSLDGDTIYQRLTEAAKDEFEGLKRSALEDASAQRKEIVERFEKEADERAAQAAAHAKTQFRDRNRPDMERRVAEVGLDIDRRNEEKYAEDKRTILELRRRDAHTRMDLGTTQALQKLTEKESELRERETQLLQHWNSELTRFIDENRKNDVARAEALAEQLSRENQIDQLRTDHLARVEELQSEAADRIRRLEAEMLRNREEAVADLKERESVWLHDSAVKDEKLNAANTLNRELTEQMERLDKTYEDYYDQKIANLVEEKGSFRDELARADRMTARSSKVMVVMFIVLTLGALAVGAIAGWTFGFSNSEPAGMILPLSTAVEGLSGSGLGGVS